MPASAMRTISNLREGQSLAQCQATVRETGGFFIDTPWHSLAYMPGSGAAARHLVVTLGNVATCRLEGELMPWGHALLARQGWSVLGVMNKRCDWFRDPALHAALADLKASGFPDEFEQITTYGTSMGGYGALALAPYFPGAHAVAFAPQSSLDLRRAPFDQRYPYGRSLGDWTVPESDAAEGLKALKSGYILFDPFVPEDKAHVARLSAPQITAFALRHCTHTMPPLLKRMDLLKPLALAALRRELTPALVAKLFRQRRSSVRYLDQLLGAARERGHHALALAAVRQALTQSNNWKLRSQFRAIRAELTSRAAS